MALAVGFFSTSAKLLKPHLAQPQRIYPTSFGGSESTTLHVSCFFTTIWVRSLSLELYEPLQVAIQDCLCDATQHDDHHARIRRHARNIENSHQFQAIN